MSQAITIVKQLISGWEALDTKAITACFPPEGIWHNMPYPPIEGREKIEAAVARFLGDTVECRFEILNFAEISPGVVVTERVDIFRSKDGPELRLPVMGIFEVQDGLIRVWRDYFDSAPFAAT